MAEISIITPTFNRAAFLGRMIKSVLAQSFQDWELLIFDDGSNDHTHKVVKAFKDPRISYFYSKHSGAGDKRNKGINRAGSEYITFLDSDDEAMPYWLEKIYKKIQGKYSLISCGYERILDNNSKFIVLPQNMGNENVKVSFKSGTLTFHRDILLGIGGFDANLASGLNTDLILRALPYIFKNRLTCNNIDRALIRVYEHSKDRIRNNNQAVLSGTLQLLEKHENWFKKNPQLYKDYLSVAAVHLAKEGKFKESGNIFNQVLRIHPRHIKDYLRFVIIHIPLLRKIIWGKIRVL